MIIVNTWEKEIKYKNLLQQLQRPKSFNVKKKTKTFLASVPKQLLSFFSLLIRERKKKKTKKPPHTSKFDGKQ